MSDMQPVPPKPSKGAALWHGVMYRLGGLLVSAGTRLQAGKKRSIEESDPI